MDRAVLFNGFHEGNGNTTIYVDGRAVKGRWAVGYPLIDNANCSLKETGRCSCFHDGANAYILEWQDYLHEYKDVEVISATVGECAHLTDKGGSLIFENCLVHVPLAGYTFVVRFGKCGGVQNTYHFGYEGFYLEPADDTTREDAKHGLLRSDIYYWIGEYEVEVAGTIFDLP